MSKCDCYHRHGTRFLCYGTKEMEECTCGGDTSKCNFYPEKRNPKTGLEPCPFCGAEMDVNDWFTVHEFRPGKWIVSHYCECDLHELGTVICVYGSTKKEAVDRWNHRAGEVANGQA